MLETSKDLLYIVLSFAVLWLTLFISWLLYYVIMIMRDAYKIMKSVKAKLDLAEQVLKTIKERVEHSAGHLTLLVESIGKIVEHAVEKKTKKSNTAKGKKKTKAIDEE